MYYELIILGTLMGGSFHGYLIAKIMQNILGPYQKLSKGRLYPLLMKLEEQGLIVADPVSEQSESRSRFHIPSRSFRLTQTGRTRFRALMLDTTSYLGEYQRIFLQKVAYFSFLQPQERLHLIEHYVGYCQSLVSYGSGRAEELAHTGMGPLIGMTNAQLSDLLTGMHHKIEQWQQELLWAQALHEQIKRSVLASASPDDEAGSSTAGKRNTYGDS